MVELGCGSGRFVLPFLNEGYKVTDVDISNESLKVLGKIAQKNNLNKGINTI